MTKKHIFIHSIRNYWMWLSTTSKLLKPSVICQSEAENADPSLNNSDILRKPNLIFLLLFILQKKSAIRIEIKTNKNLKIKLVFFIKIVLEFLRDTAEKIHEHSMDITNTTFICHVHIFHTTGTKFILSAPRYE